MTTKTFREIYDFCMTDREYREYYDVPAPERCTREQWEHYYADRGDGTTYCGTVLFGRSQERMTQFLGYDPDQILLIIDIRTFESVASNSYDGLSLAVNANITGSGVQVEFSEPFFGPYYHRYCRYTAMSEQPFSEQGVVAEVKAYCEKHFLLPPGRYREVQIERRWHRHIFLDLYRMHRETVLLEQDRLHREMLWKYAATRFITDDEAYRRLETEGVFDDMGCDEDERFQMAEQFVCDYNKGVFDTTIRFQKTIYHLDR